MFTRLAAGSLAIATSLFASAAVAEPLSLWGDNEKVAVVLKYADADTQTPAGAKRFAFRIRVAAAQVCGGDNWVVRSGSHFQVCRAGAIDRALNVLRAPMVAEALGRTPATFLARR